MKGPAPQAPGAQSLPPDFRESPATPHLTCPHQGLLGLLSPPCPLPSCLYIWLHFPPPVHFSNGWRITAVYDHIFTEIWGKQKNSYSFCRAVTSVPKENVCVPLPPSGAGAPSLSFSQPGSKSLFLPLLQAAKETWKSLLLCLTDACTSALPLPRAPGPLLLICLMPAPRKGPPPWQAIRSSQRPGKQQQSFLL